MSDQTHDWILPLIVIAAAAAVIVWLYVLL